MKISTKKLVLTAVWAAVGYVLTPIFRIPGWAAPMQHLINVSGVVILGPVYGFLCSTLLTVIYTGQRQVRFSAQAYWVQCVLILFQLFITEIPEFRSLHTSRHSLSVLASAVYVH